LRIRSEVQGDSAVSKVKNQIKEVFNVMQNNVEKVMERGSKLEDIQDKVQRDRD